MEWFMQVCTPHPNDPEPIEVTDVLSLTKSSEMKTFKNLFLPALTLILIMGFTYAPNDAATVKQILERGKLEVELAKEALESCDDPEIRDYADQMIRDHVRMDNNLSAIAFQRDWEVPENVTPEHARTRKELGEKSGREFSGAYLSESMKNQEALVGLIEKLPSNDEALANWKNTNLPIIKGHLEEARQLR